MSDRDFPGALRRMRPRRWMNCRVFLALCGGAARDVDTFVQAADGDEGGDIANVEVVQNGPSRREVFAGRELAGLPTTLEQHLRDGIDMASFFAADFVRDTSIPAVEEGK